MFIFCIKKNFRLFLSLFPLEHYQEAESLVPLLDESIYKSKTELQFIVQLSMYISFFLSVAIPIDELDVTAPNTIRVLHYLSPSCFYVCYQEKMTEYLDVNFIFSIFLVLEWSLYLVL